MKEEEMKEKTFTQGVEDFKEKEKEDKEWLYLETLSILKKSLS